LDVQREATEEDSPLKLSLKASEHCMKEDAIMTGLQSCNNIALPHGRVSFDCLGDKKSCFSFTLYNDITDDQLFNVPQQEREPFASAADCIHHPSFQKLFSTQVVSDESGLVVSRVVLVFTDVVGSTAMYAKSGKIFVKRSAKCSVVIARKRHSSTLTAVFPFRKSFRRRSRVGCSPTSLSSFIRGIFYHRPHCENRGR
jgi:hypothetical protein